ncbi:MAG: RluA family pseudouridine synthase [bacterium]|nr:RluA family pseudouridine synthase [bacterium]
MLNDSILNPRNYTYPGPERGRLDAFLTTELTKDPAYSFLTRSQIKNWIEKGNVKINDTVVLKSGEKILAGDKIIVSPPPIEPSELAPYDFPLEILFEDQEVIVINKPAGLTMHPGAGNRDKTLANAIVSKIQKELSDSNSIRPGIVHRLDKDTTGLVVVAKNLESHNALVKQFASRSIVRRYVALVRTLPKSKGVLDTKDEGTIETNIGRHPSRKTEMTVLTDDGLKAITHWKILERFPYASLVEVKLETGRTHQIRVHMTHLNAPILGDPVYGNLDMLPHDLKRACDKFGRQALHAKILGFKHPKTDEYMEFEVEVPRDFQGLLMTFKNHTNN